MGVSKVRAEKSKVYSKMSALDDLTGGLCGQALGERRRAAPNGTAFARSQSECLGGALEARKTPSLSNPGSLCTAEPKLR